MKLELSKKETLVNLSNSILKRFECQTFHHSLKYIDDILNKNKNKNVCLILLDGFGKNIIDKYKEYCPFIYSHVFKTINSIYPPTTVAATTSLLTGKYPIETGYIGWSQYFPKINSFIDIFPSTNSLTKEKIYPPITEKILNITNFIKIINNNNKYKAIQLMGFNFLKENNDYDLDLLFEEASKKIKDFDFTYLYCCEPDHYMHMNGIDFYGLKDLIKLLDIKVSNLVNNNPNTIFILVADHGMINVKNIFIDEYPLFYNSLKFKNFFIEGRFASFFVENPENFIKAYNLYYKDKFILLTKDEILQKHIFGYSNNYNINAINTLGDYFLISKGEYSFNNPLTSSSKFKPLVANHAGGTIKEKEIYISIYNNNK